MRPTIPSLSVSHFPLDSLSRLVQPDQHVRALESCPPTYALTHWLTGDLRVLLRRKEKILTYKSIKPQRSLWDNLRCSISGIRHVSSRCLHRCGAICKDPCGLLKASAIINWSIVDTYHMVCHVSVSANCLRSNRRQPFSDHLSMPLFGGADENKLIRRDESPLFGDTSKFTDLANKILSFDQCSRRRCWSSKWSKVIDEYWIKPTIYFRI